MNKKILACLNKGGAVVSVITLTKVDIPQKWGIGKNVQKLCYQTVQTCSGYENKVNNQREREGADPDFKANALTWGEWVLYPIVISHNDRTYYRMYPIEKSNPFHACKEVFFVNDRVATDAEIAIITEWRKQKAAKEKAAAEKRQGVTAKTIKCCTFEESSIIKIKSGGDIYTTATVPAWLVDAVAAIAR